MISIKQLKKISSNISILYVEDDTNLSASVVHYLSIIFDTVQSAKDGEEGLALYKLQDYDIVITDIQMPKMNGLEMIEKIREYKPKQEIIITTAFSETQYMMQSIALDVNGYILKPMDFDKMNLTLYKSVESIVLHKENENYKKNLEEMVQVRTQQNTLLEKEKIENYEKTLLSLVELVEKRDSYTGGHSIRVASYCKLIAKEMGYDEDSCNLLYKAGILHDIGKIETPDAVLLKPGALDTLEYNLIKEHVSTGYKLLNNIPMYKELSEIIVAHHERYDGTGYPNALIGDEIPELTRIMVVADAFDAMTTNRIYKSRMSIENAIKELKKFSGTQFDEKVIKVALIPLKNVVIDPNIGQLPSTQMEDKRFAYFFEDQITQAYNANYLDLVLIQNDSLSKYLSVVFLHNFSSFNQKYGWDKGNVFLKDITKILHLCCKEASVFRIHGDDFIIISDSKITINESSITKLIQENGNIISIAKKEFNTATDDISSIEKLELLL